MNQSNSESYKSEVAPDRKILVSIGGREVFLNQDAFLEKFGIKGLIRIPAEEYKNIDMTKGEFTHFNLGFAKHEQGSRYLIMPIERHGVRAEGDVPEILPLLSLDDARFTTCLECRNDISYEELTDQDFLNSMSTITNIEQLSNVMYIRYGKTRGLTEEQVKQTAVSRTVLEIGEKFTETDLVDIKI